MCVDGNEVQRGRPGDHVWGWDIGGGARLRIPPYGPCCAGRIDNDCCVRGKDQRGTVGVESRVSIAVACMPAVDDQRSRAWTEAGDMIVQFAELILDR